MKNSILLFIGIFTVLIFGLEVARAQTPPPAETTYTDAGDGLWITGANWDNGVPVLPPGPNDDALIAAGESVFYDADISGGGIPFGTLTIGEGATFDYDSIGGTLTDFTNGAVMYLMNNSQFIISGVMNSAIDYNIAGGNSATVTITGTVQDRPRGTIVGAGNLEFVKSNGGWIQPRWDAGSFTGNITFSGSGYLREFGGNTTGQVLGAGTNTIGTNIDIEQNTSHKVPDAATVVLVGAANGNDEKWSVGVDRSETIANLIIQSPIAASTAPYILVHNGYLKATDSVSFTGAATNVYIHSTYGPASSWPGELDARGADVTFGGTGAWTVSGNNIIFWVNASSSINTINNATISGRVDGGFTKSGAGTLTIGDLAIDGGIIVSEGDIVCTTSVTFAPSDYVEFVGADVSFSADYGGTFTNIGDVNAAIGPAGYFRPQGAAVDNGTSFTVIPPPTGTLVIIK